MLNVLAAGVPHLDVAARQLAAVCVGVQDVLDQRGQQPERILLVLVQRQQQQRSHVVHALAVADLLVVRCEGHEHALERLLPLWAGHPQVLGEGAGKVLRAEARQAFDRHAGDPGPLYIRIVQGSTRPL